ncbi:trehalase-like isoform X2 [Mercenaria mercenaria]|nr:trehalase-like isoform X2 [Mercenaria mercenaria]
MNLKSDPDVVLSAFVNISDSGTPRKSQIREFLKTYFEGPNMEFEKWTPTDYLESSAFLAGVKDEELRKFGKALCKKWQLLGRKIKQDVKINPDRYSLIYLDHPFIVPGGRFRETYYWDSYWVIKGLLVCEMKATVKGMLENFISLVKRYGMVPNGNRIYYTRRSQPPFLIPMVDLYIEATNDIDFLRESIPYLADEYKFWMTNRSVKYNVGNNQEFVLNRYAAPITKPRPESYTEDISTKNKQSRVSPSEMYQNLASAAESGWDFSSRWFSQEFQDETSDETRWLSYTDTTDVIPVDLNSILCWNEMLMAKFYNSLGEQNASMHYRQQQKARQDAMMSLFWDQEKGVWFDLSLAAKSKRQRFFPSNVFPLFVGCYDKGNSKLESQVLAYLKDKNVIDFASGVPSSLLQTGQQWDFPNAWPPLQDILISALTDGDLPEGRQVGLELASRWIQSNYIGWNRTHNMFEKYVVTSMGSRGSGGEYDVQDGFGWTNGVILDFLERFGQNLTLDYTTSNGNGSHLPPRLVLTTVLLTITLFCFSYFITKHMML